ncbi:hypothetical protein AcV5_003973 [Taiwanofungus camphoratus]|nr:hypothetical protein AcV5_003973 [Antrodia cinnamomea]
MGAGRVSTTHHDLPNERGRHSGSSSSPSSSHSSWSSLKEFLGDVPSCLSPCSFSLWAAHCPAQRQGRACFSQAEVRTELVPKHSPNLKEKTDLILAVMGLGGGGVLTLSSVILSDIVALHERGLYNGILGLAWSAASGVGPVIGGSDRPMALAVL